MAVDDAGPFLIALLLHFSPFDFRLIQTRRKFLKVSLVSFGYPIQKRPGLLGVGHFLDDAKGRILQALDASDNLFSAHVGRDEIIR